MSYQNIESLKQIILQMQSDGYVEAVEGKLLFTMKFHHAIAGLLPEKTDKTLSLLPDDALVLDKIKQDWTMGFINFIQEAKIPTVQVTREGSSYPVNKYSVEAMKVFRKAIEKEEIHYHILVKSTLLYYKSATGYKKTIGNYFTQGDWRTDYYALIDAASNGTLDTHIKEQIYEQRKSQYGLG